MRKFFIVIFLPFLLYTTYSQKFGLEQYLNIRGAGSPQYSYDNTRIYFIMTVTGTNQLWYCDKPGMWPKQVTFFQDRISGYSANPKRDLVLIEKDEGGSEYNQFYLAKGDGTEMIRLTDNAPKVLYDFGRWSPDGSFFSYLSNKRSPYYYDVYIYDIDKKTSEMVFSSDNSNYPSEFSPDGKYLVISRSYTSDDNDIYILDLVTKELTLITKHDNFNDPAEFSPVTFSAEGSELYYISNKNSDFFRLAKYDISNGVSEYVELSFLKGYEHRDISQVVFSNDKSRILIQVNDEGYDKLFMYDVKNRTEITIPNQIKSTSITALTFSKDDKKLIVGINSAANPSVLYEWDLSTRAVTQVTYPVLAGVDPLSFVEPKLIRYKSFDGLEIPAFVYLPKNSGSKNIPCIIAIHGGPEGQATYGFAPVYQYFLNAGYAIVEPNVRGSTGYGKKYSALDNIRNREKSVKDIEYLVKYIKSRGDIDPGRIAVYGGSYGGYMVLACLTLYPELFAAGVDIVGIANFVTFLENTADYRRSHRESEYGSLEKDHDFLQNISPINKVDMIKAPLMIIHGRNDPRVPVGEAEQMYKAISESGRTAELLIYEDEGHGLAKLKNRLDAYPKMVKFLDKYVKDK
ncbi:MAG: prolyl oligopeptidase family serine peptidase [Ignavibacteria bacterium]